MSRVLASAAFALLAFAVATEARAGNEKLQQCRYDAPALTTCSGLMGEDLFRYTDDKLCAQRQPGYLILAYAGGMHKYAVEIRRFGGGKPVYRMGTGGFEKARYSFEIGDALHVVGDDVMLVIRRAKNSVVEVWKRGACKTVSVDTDALERNAANARNAP
ncbi:MAG: hypothetical protein KIT16_24205 [Rhodospirillaceae bacterium]|nr:hypothetical protein [Rhodospirillaceae bacterium]